MKQLQPLGAIVCHITEKKKNFYCTKEKQKKTHQFSTIRIYYILQVNVKKTESNSVNSKNSFH